MKHVKVITRYVLVALLVGLLLAILCFIGQNVAISIL